MTLGGLQILSPYALLGSKRRKAQQEYEDKLDRAMNESKVKQNA